MLYVSDYRNTNFNAHIKKHMQFVPLEITGESLNPSLYGAVIPKVPKSRIPLYSRGVQSGAPEENTYEIEPETKPKINGGTLIILLIVIFITVIIFVVLIAAYDVIREKISNYYAKRALTDPHSNNNKENIARTLIANEEAYNSVKLFAFVAILIAVITLPVLFYAYVYFHS